MTNNDLLRPLIESVNELRRRVEDVERQEVDARGAVSDTPIYPTLLVRGVLAGDDTSLASDSGLTYDADAKILTVATRLTAGTAALGTHPSYGTSYSGFWRDANDYTLLTDGSNTFVNATGGTLFFRINNTTKAQLDASSNLTVNGDIYLGARSSWLSTYLNQAVRSDSSPTFVSLTATGNLSIAGTSTLSGAVTTGANLTVAGDLTIQNYYVNLGSWSTDFVVRRNAGDRILYFTGGNSFSWNSTADANAGGMLVLAGNSSWRQGAVQLWGGGSIGGIALLTNQTQRFVVNAAGDITFGGPDAQSGQRVTIYGENSFSTKYALVVRNAFGSNLFYARNDGQLWANQNWTVGSDEKNKEQVEPNPYGLTTIKALKPKKYTKKDSGTVELGLFAQDVQPVLPEAVSEHTNTTDGTPELGIRYGDLIAVLVSAVQELAAEIEKLKADKK